MLDTLPVARTRCCLNFDRMGGIHKIEDRIEQLRLATVPENKRFMVRNVSSTNGDDLELYYVGLINDALSEIRKGHSAYLFSLQQVADLFRFEPYAKVLPKDGYYIVSNE